MKCKLKDEGLMARENRNRNIIESCLWGERKVK